MDSTGSPRAVLVLLSMSGLDWLGMKGSSPVISPNSLVLSSVEGDERTREMVWTSTCTS